jgi:hypothetical protein
MFIGHIQILLLVLVVVVVGSSSPCLGQNFPSLHPFVLRSVNRFVCFACAKPLDGYPLKEGGWPRGRVGIGVKIGAPHISMVEMVTVIYIYIYMHINGEYWLHQY